MAKAAFPDLLQNTRAALAVAQAVKVRTTTFLVDMPPQAVLQVMMFQLMLYNAGWHLLS